MAVVQMPRIVSRFTVEDIRAALRQSSKPLPSLPRGHFEVIGVSEEHQVALFKHKSVTGCRNTTSQQHSLLPMPIPCHKAITELTTEPNIRVGFEYIFGHSQPYSVVDRKVRLEDPTLPVTGGDETTENRRTTVMISALENRFGGNFEISGAGQESSRYCPFSGGGDIYLLRKTPSTSAAALVHGVPHDVEWSDPDPDPTDVTPPAVTVAASADITPPKPGELRCGATENKMLYPSQTETDVRLQLQANMMLISSLVLLRKLEKRPEAAESIRVITCYGLQMGPTYPLKILKLTIDFENSLCKYEEQFKLYPCGVYSAYIDIALAYILQSL